VNLEENESQRELDVFDKIEKKKRKVWLKIMLFV